MIILYFEEPIGVARRSEVVRFGLPFPPGAWHGDAPPAFLATGKGNIKGLLDYRIEQRWPDDSIRLAFFAVVLDLEAQGHLQLFIDVANAPEAPFIEPKDLGWEPGKLQQTLHLTVRTQQGAPQEIPLIPGAERAGRVPFQPARTREGLELSGMLTCIGQGKVILSLTLSNMSTETVVLKEIVYGVDFSSLLDEPHSVDLSIGEAYREWTTQERCEYLQLSAQGQIAVAGESVAEVNALGRECRINHVWVGAGARERAYTFAVRNLFENFPAKLEADQRGLRFSPWSREAGVFDFPAGMSKTYEIGIALRSADAPAHHEALVVQFPLVPQISPQTLSILGCFPRTATYRPRRYPRLEAWIKWMIGNRPRAYGLLHFGDEPNHGYTARGSGRILWTNNEYDYPLIALTQYLRTGDRIAWEDGRAATLHMMDIDSIVADPDPMQVGGQHSHSPGHTTHPAAPDHEWLEGLLMYYLITDDARALQRAGALAGRLLRLTEAGEFDDIGKSPRRYGWTLIALCAMHAFSAEERYLEAARRIVHTMLESEKAYGGLRWAYWDTPYRYLDGFMVGIAGAGLCRYHALTSDAQVGEAIIRTCDALLELASPEGILHYKEFPLVRLPGDISSCIVLEVLAYGYQLTGEREYLLCGARNAEQALHLTESGLMITWNAEQRIEAEGGVYLRETSLTPNAQMIGIMLRGI